MSQHQEQGVQTDLPEIVVRTINETIHLTDSRRENFVSELKELLEIASASTNPLGLNAMATLLSDKLQRIGMKSTLFKHPSGNAVLGEIRGENSQAETILLLGHHDTVYGEGVSAPQVLLDGDTFYGPGSVDMKACLLQAIYALEGLLERTKYRDFNKILFLSLPDEEVFTKNHSQLLAQICQEHPLVLVLEGATSPGNIVIRRRGGARFKLTAHGVSAHAGSHPEQGRSAVLEIAHQTVQFCTLERSIEGVSINAAPIAGGEVPNVVADRAHVSFGLRFWHKEDHETIVAQWQACMQQQLVEGVTLTLTPEGKLLPPLEATEASLAMAEKARSILSWLGVAYHPENRGGGSDGGRTSAFGCPTLDGFGAVGAAPHSPKEHILLQYVPQRAGFLAGLIAFLTMREKESEGYRETGM